MTAAARHAVCPPPTARGLSREGAANYIGVGLSLFDQMVGDGRMPKPKRINARNVWDVRAIDKAFDLLPGGGGESDEDWDVEV